MAATQCATSPRRSTVSHADTISVNQEQDLRQLIEKLKHLLSDTKRDLAQIHIINTVKRLIFLTSIYRPTHTRPSYRSVVDLTSGMLNKPSEEQLLEILKSEYVQRHFFDVIISRFIPSEEDLIALREHLPLLYKNKILVIKLLKEWSPHVNLQVVYSNLEASLKNKHNLMLFLSLLMQNCTIKAQYCTALLRILQLFNNANLSSCVHRCCASILLSTEDNSFLFEAIDSDAESFQALSQKLCNWLIYTPMKKLKPSPQIKKVRSEKASVIQELDGSPSRDFFTVLNIAHVYNNGQLNNIHAFSMLMHWLTLMQQYNADTWNYVMKKLSSVPRSATAMARIIGKSSFYVTSSSSSDSSEPVSLSSSLSSLHSFLYVDGDNDRSKTLDDSLAEDSFNAGTPPSHHVSMQSITSQDFSPRPASVSTPIKDGSFDRRKFSSSSFASLSSPGGLTLKNASVKYCLRILSQAEKIPRRLGDKEILIASVIEAVRILTILCQEDELLVNKIFPEIKRVNSRILGKSKDGRKHYPADIQFFIEHFEGINAKEPIDTYLRIVPSQLFTSSSASFEVLDLCLRNIYFFERHPGFLSKFFPNLFKIAAWHPRTFLYEFLELMPALVSEATAVELFHTIIDIPCTAALLELSTQSNLDRYLKENLESSTSDHLSFLSNSHRFISDFFTRCESGGPETIDKLDRVYLALKPLSNRVRIQVSAQIVPLLLGKFFECVYALNNENVLELLMPSILERVFVLHQSESFQHEVRTVLSTQIMRICSARPSIISIQQEEFLSVFKQIRTKCPGMKSVITSLVYCIGEFSIRTGICSVEQISKYYEIIETLLYETKTSLFYMDDFLISAEVISSLISTAGKLAACSQDFVPKTVLCLTKLANQKWQINKCRLSQREFEIVMSRAIDVINLLRLPDVSPSVLCSGCGVAPWNEDKNTSILLKVHAMARIENSLGEPPNLITTS